MSHHRPARTTLVLVGLLCSSLPLLAKEAKPQAEVPSDMPAELSITEKEKREPARVGPSLTDEPEAPKDLVPGENSAAAPEGKPVRLLDNTSESGLDTPAETDHSEVDQMPEQNGEETSARANAAADAVTEEEKLAAERLQEMQNDQAKAQAEARAEEEAKAKAEARAEEEAQSLAAAKAAAEAEKAEKATSPTGRQPSDEDTGATLSASARLSKYESPRHFGLDLQFSPLRYPNVGLTSTPQGAGGRVLFEWMFFQDAGKFAVGVGARFSSLPRADDSTGQSLKLNAIGAEGSLVYRADFVDHQLLVPFGKVGLDFDYAVLSRSDGSTANQGLYQGIQYGGGLEVNLYIFERKNATLLDRKFGINETFFILEYVKTTATKAGNIDLAHDEFRFGLRFEI